MTTKPPAPQGISALLRANLDEDEAVAKLAAREGGTWKQDDPGRYPGSITSLGGQVVYDEGSPDENQAPHIARHDPARSLREVAVHREILALCETETDETGGKPLAVRVMHLLASIYEPALSAEGER